jgi:hypothetical protein
VIAGGLVLLLSGAGVVVAIVAIARSAGPRAGTSVPERLLTVLASFSDDDRRAWVTAMLAEIAAVDELATRRRFAWGCVWALVATPRHTTRAARTSVAVLGAGIASCGALAVYGLVHYPGLREGISTVIYVAGFAVVLVGYGVAGVILAGLGSARAHWLGVAIALPAVLLTAFAEAGPGPASAAVGLCVVLLPGLAAYMTARTDRESDSGWRSGLVSGATCALVGGLLAFIGFVVATYLTGGGSPTDELLAEFHSSGAADYATWAIGDNLGGAVFLLCFVPVVGIATTAIGTSVGRVSPVH